MAALVIAFAALVALRPAWALGHRVDLLPLPQVQPALVMPAVQRLARYAETRGGFCACDHSLTNATEMPPT